MRLDVCSIDIGPTTTLFTPTSKTKMFFDRKSIELIALISISEISTNAKSYQDYISHDKYTANLTVYRHTPKRRASSSLSSRPYFQPTTIRKLLAQDGTSQMSISQDKIGLLIFRTIATQMFINGRGATLHVNDINEIAFMVNDKAVASILGKIKKLFGNQESIDIIGNSALNNQLVGLANKINKERDDKKIRDIANELYD